MRRVQINMQAKWGRIFAIVFAVLIWAVTFALVELCVGYFSFWWMRRSVSEDLQGVFTLVGCFAGIPLSGFVATFIVRMFDDAW